MTEEIKEILDRLERIDHKEYCCGFEFADSGSFDEDCRCFEERKKLANYITNLQKENEELKKQIPSPDNYVPIENQTRITSTNILLDTEISEKINKYEDYK